MAKRTMVYTSIYAPNTMLDDVWAKVELALAQAGIDWDGEWETVRCEQCDSKYDCDCTEEQEER